MKDNKENNQQQALKRPRWQPADTQQFAPINREALIGKNPFLIQRKVESPVVQRVVPVAVFLWAVGRYAAQKFAQGAVIDFTMQALLEYILEGKVDFADTDKYVSAAWEGVKEIFGGGKHVGAVVDGLNALVSEYRKNPDMTPQQGLKVFAMGMGQSYLFGYIVKKLGKAIYNPNVIRKIKNGLARIGISGAAVDAFFDKYVKSDMHGGKQQPHQPEPKPKAPEPKVQPPKSQKPKPKPKPKTQRPKPKPQKQKPRVEEVKPRVEEVKPHVEEVKPHVEEVKPHVEEVKPHVEEVKPHVEEVKPHVEEVKPHAEEIKEQVKKHFEAFKKELGEKATENGWTLKYTDDELAKIIAHGNELGVAEHEMRDIILNGCRPKKDFSMQEVMSQMSFWKQVEKRGFPNLFENMAEFHRFSDVVKNLTSSWGLPNSAIFVQGSSLRVADASKIGDLDIAIKVDAKTFDELVERFKKAAQSDKVKKRIGNNGKIGGVDMKGGAGSFVGEFYSKFKEVFGKEFGEVLGVDSIQISVIREGSKIDISPFLKLP